MNKEQIEKYGISIFFKYAEERTGDRIEFGWIPADNANLPAIISSSSSEIIKTNAASVSDYRLYLKALVGESPEEIISEWSDSSEFSDYWNDLEEQYDRKQGALLYKMANLIVNGKKFNAYGLSYRMIK